MSGDKVMENVKIDCFENTFSNPDFAELNMYYCGKRIKTLSHRYGPEMRTHFLVVFIKDGRGTLFMNDKKVRMKSGDLLVMFPNEKIYYEADIGTEWTISWVGIYGTAVKKLFYRAGITEKSPVYTTENPAEIGALFEEIYRFSFMPDTKSKMYIISKLYEFFSLILPRNDKKVHMDIIDEVAHLLDYNCDISISISDMANALHISPSYLSRSFKKHFGISPKEYMLKKKIDRAKHLLLYSGIKVSEVSLSVGISDPLYFSRLFKKYVGSSPSEYAKHSGKY